MLLSKLFQFVFYITSKYSIDESHGISHSMNALYYSNQIFESEIVSYPDLKKYERLIYVSAVVHDMCDKKYMNEMEGIKEVETYLKEKDVGLEKFEVETVKNIISTMSYSTVKKNGYPDLGEYQKAYHIVREADLLTAYDFDRSMIYHMCVNKSNLKESFLNAEDLFKKRVLMHNRDKLFITPYSNFESRKLHMKAIRRMEYWKNILIKRI
jgi:HD superfamily phosphodiesterase